MPKILPVFLPFASCGNKCIFCDQQAISGVQVESDLLLHAEKQINQWKTYSNNYDEIAFYGGNFCAINKDIRLSLYEKAYNNGIKKIRFSTDRRRSLLFRFRMACPGRDLPLGEASGLDLLYCRDSAVDGPRSDPFLLSFRKASKARTQQKGTRNAGKTHASSCARARRAGTRGPAGSLCRRRKGGALRKRCPVARRYPSHSGVYDAARIRGHRCKITQRIRNTALHPCVQHTLSGGRKAACLFLAQRYDGNGNI